VVSVLTSVLHSSTSATERSESARNATRHWSTVRVGGPRFTEDLRIILTQFLHLRSSEDNEIIYRTLATYLKARLKTESCNFVTDLAII